MTTTTTEAPTLEHLDPKTLTIGLNIRSADKVDLNPEFLTSVKDRGVLVPIVGHREDDGTVVVDEGQRRTLAAVIGDLTTVPVYIHPASPDTYGRVVDQWAENHHRKAMDLSDEVAAVDELALFGVPADLIASTLNLDPETLHAARKVVASPTAKEYVSSGLSLEYAELVADMEADGVGGERLIEVFNDAAAGQDVEHVRERYESEKSRAKAIAYETALLEADGVRVVERPTDYGPLAPEWSGLYNLVGVTEETHKTCPGHAVYLSAHQTWRDLENPWMVTTQAVCTDWKANGHEQRVAYQSSEKKVPASELPDEEREAAKAERKRVIESNKAWKEATTVRAKWLLGLGKSTANHVGAEKFITGHLLSWLGTSATHLPLVGLDRDKVTAELNRASAKRAAHLTLCIVVASIEDHLTDDAWRSQLEIAGPYLDILSKWGYGLSEIEKRIIADAKAAAKGKKK